MRFVFWAFEYAHHLSLSNHPLNIQDIQTYEFGFDLGVFD
jgi:hypothetical protein